MCQGPYFGGCTPATPVKRPRAGSCTEPRLCGAKRLRYQGPDSPLIGDAQARLGLTSGCGGCRGSSREATCLSFGNGRCPSGVRGTEEYQDLGGHRDGNAQSGTVSPVLAAPSSIDSVVVRIRQPCGALVEEAWSPGPDWEVHQTKTAAFLALKESSVAEGSGSSWEDGGEETLETKGCEPCPGDFQDRLIASLCLQDMGVPFEGTTQGTICLRTFRGKAAETDVDEGREGSLAENVSSGDGCDEDAHKDRAIAALCLEDLLEELEGRYGGEAATGVMDGDCGKCVRETISDDVLRADDDREVASLFLRELEGMSGNPVCSRPSGGPNVPNESLWELYAGTYEESAASGIHSVSSLSVMDDEGTSLLE